MEKEINKYKIKFFGGYSKETDKIDLNITICDKLKKLLNSARSEREGKIDFSIEDNTLLRYKIKTPIHSEINIIDYYHIIFTDKLLDDGKIRMKLTRFTTRERIIRNIKEGVNKIISALNKEDIDESYTIKTVSEDTEK